MGEQFYRAVVMLKSPSPTAVGAALQMQSCYGAYTHERLELQDADFLDLVWTVRKDGPIVVTLTRSDILRMVMNDATFNLWS